MPVSLAVPPHYKLPHQYEVLLIVEMNVILHRPSQNV